MEQELFDLITTYAPQVLVYGGYVVASSIVLRLVAEALNFVSVKTENKTDDKVAAVVSEVSWQLAKVAALFSARTTIARPEHLRDEDKPK